MLPSPFVLHSCLNQHKTYCLTQQELQCHHQSPHMRNWQQRPDSLRGKMQKVQPGFLFAYYLGGIKPLLGISSPSVDPAALGSWEMLILVS